MRENLKLDADQYWNKMPAEINSKTIKEYGIEAGACVVGIAASRDFGLAPVGFRPTDVLNECILHDNFS